MAIHHHRVLVTRPPQQGQPLVNAIIAAGGQAWLMPMLAIESLPETQSMQKTVSCLDQFDIVIVTSRHAAAFGMKLIQQQGAHLPVKQQWFAIGEATAQALAAFSIHATYAQHGNDSEALLAIHDLRQIKDKKILIIKGKDGRALLNRELNDRKALVTALDVYQRVCPPYEADALLERLAYNAIDTLLCSSGETLTNMCHYLPLRQRSYFQLLVPSDRIAQQAAKLGFKQIIVTDGAHNEAVLTALHQMTPLVHENIHSIGRRKSDCN